MSNLPQDSLFSRGKQWYLENKGQSGGEPGMDLNVTSVWEDYTGKGVRVAIVDDGVNYLHPDLDNNYDTKSDVDSFSRNKDGAPVLAYDNHGTAVAGIIAAEANGKGSVGVAFGTTISSVRLNFANYSSKNEAFALRQMADFDVANNSWGYVVPFSDNFQKPEFSAVKDALEYCASEGRDGLGTVMVFSGGNARLNGGNANYHNLKNSRYTIAVGALNHNGFYTYYSTPGASLLVSAFGGDRNTDGITSTDRTGRKGYSGGNYLSNFGGTSAAAPMVSGIAALMLEANPNLGYRDVQEILAYSARQVDSNNLSWQTNGATNWNGGGLHTSSDYGFGLVDAHAAVRLAETWTEQSTFSNEKHLQRRQTRATTIPDSGTAESQITFNQELDIDQVEIKVKIAHSYVGDLDLTLVSPNGTKSVLMTSDPYNWSSKLRFTFSSTQFWGENTAGTWTLQVGDRFAMDTGVLEKWTLSAYGDACSNNDKYIYTNEFGKFGADKGRAVLKDLAGNDTLNAAAVSSNSVLNLCPGGSSTIAGRLLKLADDTVIETAIAGHGNDTLIGNNADNTLGGGRGNDVLTGGDGGDRFTFFTKRPGIDTITDFVSGNDKIVLSKSIFSIIGAIDGSFRNDSDFAQVADDSDVADSNARIVYSHSSGGLFYNANGSADGMGDGGQFAILAGAPTLGIDDLALAA